MSAFHSLLLAGLFGATLAATGTANAERIGVRVGFGAPVVNVGYVPACPGPDYSWNAGYYAGANWYPGRWIYQGRADARGYGRDDHAYYNEHRDGDHDRGFRDSRGREGHEGYRR